MCCIVIANGATSVPGSRSCCHGLSTNRRRNRRNGRLGLYDPGWAKRSGAIAERLKSGAESAVEEAEQLLDEQHGYFDRSGNGNNLVRSATRFSAAIRKSRPALALAWARLAKVIEPWDGYAWTNEGAALIAQGNFPDAVAVYRETKARFPEDAVARNGLAETLKAWHKLPEAEAEYRETLARFPGDSYAHTGLAGVLKARGEIAGTEYRETEAPLPKIVRL